MQEKKPGHEMRGTQCTKQTKNDWSVDCDLFLQVKTDTSLLAGIFFCFCSFSLHFVQNAFLCEIKQVENLLSVVSFLDTRHLQ